MYDPAPRRPAAESLALRLQRLLHELQHTTTSALILKTSREGSRPGQGPIVKKSDLKFYNHLLVSVRDKVAALKKQGKSLHEIIALKPTAAYDAKWGDGFMGPQMFTALVFEGA